MPRRGARTRRNLARGARLHRRARAQRDVAAERVVSRGLVGDDVGLPAAGDELGHHLGAVAHEPDRHRVARGLGLVGPPQRFVEIGGLAIEVAGRDPALDASWIDLDAERDTVVHRDRERLRATHAAEAARERDGAGERPAEVLVRTLGERLVRALQDALGADVDPRPRRHLPVHREALRLERPERLPVGPLGHEHRVRDQHSRGHVVGAEDRDRLARLHEQGLVVGQRPERAHDRVERLPAAGGLAGAAVHDQVLGPLGHLGVEVVHQHAHRRFLRPGTARQLAATWRTDLSTGHRVPSTARRLPSRRDATATACSLAVIRRGVLRGRDA